MDSRIVKDTVVAIVNRKIDELKARGVIVANYDEVLRSLNRMGYSEAEVQDAIRQLVANKEIKAGKFSDKRGWLREYRECDRNVI
jgi:Holliday junction resolvasome RuvABC DNA-binding subunit